MFWFLNLFVTFLLVFWCFRVCAHFCTGWPDSVWLCQGEESSRHCATDWGALCKNTRHDGNFRISSIHIACPGNLKCHVIPSLSLYLSLSPFFSFSLTLSLSLSLSLSHYLYLICPFSLDLRYPDVLSPLIYFLHLVLCRSYLFSFLVLVPFKPVIWLCHGVELKQSPSDEEWSGWHDR